MKIPTSLGLTSPVIQKTCLAKKWYTIPHIVALVLNGGMLCSSNGAKQAPALLLQTSAGNSEADATGN